MIFNRTEEEEIFEKIIDDFCKEYGKEALKATFYLNRELNKKLGIRYFPILNIYHYLLYKDFKTKYKTVPLKKIAEIEGISVRSIYYFFHNFVKPRRKKECKNTLPKN